MWWWTLLWLQRTLIRFMLLKTEFMRCERKWEIIHESIFVAFLISFKFYCFNWISFCRFIISSMTFKHKNIVLFFVTSCSPFNSPSSCSSQFYKFIFFLWLLLKFSIRSRPSHFYTKLLSKDCKYLFILFHSIYNCLALYKIFEILNS